MPDWSALSSMIDGDGPFSTLEAYVCLKRDMATGSVKTSNHYANQWQWHHRRVGQLIDKVKGETKQHPVAPPPEPTPPAPKPKKKPEPKPEQKQPELLPPAFEEGNAKFKTPIPANVPRELVVEFYKHRQAIKKPLTERSYEMLIKELSRLEKEGYDIARIIRDSVMNGWQDIYEKDHHKKKKPDSFSKSGLEMVY